jgi:hypothetical protein
MNRALAAVLFALAGTGLELALVMLGVPFLLVLAVGIALFATGLLVSTWHPAALAASVTLYLVAALLGLVDFSLLGVVFSAV